MIWLYLYGAFCYSLCIAKEENWNWRLLVEVILWPFALSCLFIMKMRE